MDGASLSGGTDTDGSVVGDVGISVGVGTGGIVSGGNGSVGDVEGVVGDGVSVGTIVVGAGDDDGATAWVGVGLAEVTGIGR